MTTEGSHVPEHWGTPKPATSQPATLRVPGPREQVRHKHHKPPSKCPFADGVGGQCHQSPDEEPKWD